jgi:hypothetical protein
VRRREFITLLGGAAAAWPLAARAQQGERMRRVGVLMSTAADDRVSRARLAAFVQGLQEQGWTPSTTTCNSTFALPLASLSFSAGTRPNWSRSRPTAIRR